MRKPVTPLPLASTRRQLIVTPARHAATADEPVNSPAPPCVRPSTFAVAVPAVPAACQGNALLGAEGCKTNGFDNFDKIAFWKTPQAEGGKYVPYSRWTQDYIAIMGGR